MKTINYILITALSFGLTGGCQNYPETRKTEIKSQYCEAREDIPILSGLEGIERLTDEEMAKIHQ